MYRTLASLLFLMLSLPVWAMPLVTPEWIDAHKKDPDLVLLDLQPQQNYIRFHIPGSINTDINQWRTEKQGQPKVLPPVKILEQLIGNLGIGNDTHVVLIPLGASAGDLTQAARLYWTFKVLGHDNVSILNGGLVSYAEARRFPLEKGSNNPTPKAFKAHYRADYNPDTPAVRQAIESGALAVDNRSRAEYLGIYGGGEGTRAGSLPDAVNLNYDWLTVNGGGKLQSEQNLKKIYGISEVPLEGEQIHYCHTGNRAALGWFVSHEILGNSQARLYDGSTEVWAADPSLPMQKRVDLSH
ncbi:MAG: rhodanese-like domain-containing protein [Candidatus Thiodiazotropha sp.]